MNLSLQENLKRKNLSPSEASRALRTQVFNLLFSDDFRVDAEYYTTLFNKIFEGRISLNSYDDVDPYELISVLSNFVFSRVGVKYFGDDFGLFSKFIFFEADGRHLLFI